MSEVVEAIYDFQPQSEGDLEIRAGQQIEVQEHLSADWLRGKNMSTGHEGVFPANYVKPAEKRRSFSRPPASVPSGKIDSPQPFSEKEQYQPPPPSWGQQQYQPPQYQQYAPPQQYQPPQQHQPPQQYQQPQQYQPPEQIMMPPQQPEQPQQQPQQHHHAFGNMARRFGDSMLFGAGATLGGDIINKIF